MRKDSHVNSLELSLTQKNEEIEMVEEKLERLTKQHQHQQMALANSQQSSSNQLEMENMRKQCMHLQKDVSTKEIQIQQLTSELITLKEIIDEFEEQKQMLKSKLEQQQAQFVQLERHFESTTNEFKTQLKEQKQMFDEEKAGMEQQQLQQRAHYEAEIVQVKTKLDALVNNTENLQQQQRTAADQDQHQVDSLTQQIELEKEQNFEKEEQILKFKNRISHLEEALRESVSITAEREFVFAQQKMKNEKIDEDVNLRNFLWSKILFFLSFCLF